MADLRTLTFNLVFNGDTAAINQANTAADNLGGTFKKLGGIVATAFAADKIISFGKASIESAASALAIGSQFEQTFAEFQPAAQSAIDGMATEFGMVPNRLKPAMSQMTSMFKGLGLDTTQSMEKATDAITVSADAAAFYDKSFDEANGSLTSFIKGNYEGGEAIGLFANDTQMAAYAVESGLIGMTKEWAGMDEAQKQATRLEYAQNMQKLAGATGQAARESDGYENQLGNINQAWQDFLAIVGGPVLGGVIDIMKSITTNIQAAGDKVIFLQDGFNGLGDPAALSGLDADLYQVGEKVRQLSDGFQLAVSAVGDFINAHGGISGVITTVEILVGAFVAVKTAMMIGGIISAVSTAFGVLTGVMGALIIANIASVIETGILVAMYAGETIAAGAAAVATGVMTAAQWALNAALTANPIGIIIALIVAFVAGIVYLWNTNEGFRNAIISIWEAIKGAFSAAWEGIQAAWSACAPFFQAVWDGIVAVFNAVVGFFVGIYQAEWDGIMAVWGAAVGFFEGIVSGIQSAFSNISQFIIDAFNGAVTFLQELPGKALEWATDMMQGFIDGIKNGITAVGDAIKAVADKITSFIHFTRPDEGPLRQYETWMPDMMQGLAAGITDNVGLVKQALGGMTTDMNASVTGQINGIKSTSSSSGSGGGGGTMNFSPNITVNVNGGGQVKESFSSIEQQLNLFMDEFAQKMALRNPKVAY